MGPLLLIYQVGRLSANGVESRPSIVQSADDVQNSVKNDFSGNPGSKTKFDVSKVSGENDEFSIW